MWEGVPKVPTPWPRYLPPQVRTGEGVAQGTYPPHHGTYPPSRSGWGRGSYYPKVPNPPAKVPTPPGQDGGYPKVPTPHHGTYPPSRSGWGRGSHYPRYLTPGQGTYPSRSGRGRGYPKVPTPWPSYLPFQVRTVEGVAQGT